jgi:iron(III) transport system substrate-binding protein
MSRWILLVLFVVVLVSPLLVSWRMGAQARRGGADDSLVIMTAHQEAIRHEFADAFATYYHQKTGRTAGIEYLTYGGSDIVKYLDEVHKRMFKEKGTYGVDLVWGGGDYLFEAQLKKPGYLAPIQFDAAFLKEVYPEPTLTGLPLYDLDPKAGPSWFGTALSSFGIVYNRDVLKCLGVSEPKTWKDLADPKLAGWVCLADPTRSASAKQAYMVIVERAMADASAAGRTEDSGWADGMGLIRLISANARLYTDSSSVVPIMVSQGDAAAGMAIDFYGRSQANAVGNDRMGYVEPENATIINPDPIAMVKGAPNRAVAEEFIRFVLSPEGQRLWNTKPGLPGGPRQTALRRLPIRRDLYADMENHTDPVNPFIAASLFNKSNAREATFGILGELIQASCIDLLDDLIQTRKWILASPRAQALDAQLGRFPFGETEAKARMAAWKPATASERLQSMRDWTAQFRLEYARLRAEAAGEPPTSQP